MNSLGIIRTAVFDWAGWRITVPPNATHLACDTLSSLVDSDKPACALISQQPPEHRVSLCLQVELFNRGDIEAEYTLTSGAGPFCEYFTFSPPSGLLKRGDVHPIDITFCCDQLGEFDETFICQIEGSAEVRVVLPFVSRSGPHRVWLAKQPGKTAAHPSSPCRYFKDCVVSEPNASGQGLPRQALCAHGRRSHVPLGLARAHACGF